MSSITSHSCLSSRSHVKLAVYVLFSPLRSMIAKPSYVCSFLINLSCVLHEDSFISSVVISFTLLRQTGIRRSCLAPERERSLSSESVSSQILTRSIVNLQTAILSTTLRMSSWIVDWKGHCPVDHKALHQWVVVRSASSHLLLYFLSDVMSKIIQRFYWDLFSSIVIERHIFLSLFFTHESVSYITDLMDNFDSDTGRHELFFLTCNRCFSHLPTSSRPTFLHVLLLILRHL